MDCHSLALLCKSYHRVWLLSLYDCTFSVHVERLKRTTPFSFMRFISKLKGHTIPLKGWRDQYCQSLFEIREGSSGTFLRVPLVDDLGYVVESGTELANALIDVTHDEEDHWSSLIRLFTKKYKHQVCIDEYGRYATNEFMSLDPIPVKGLDEIGHYFVGHRRRTIDDPFFITEDEFYTDRACHDQDGYIQYNLIMSQFKLTVMRGFNTLKPLPVMVLEGQRRVVQFRTIWDTVKITLPRDIAPNSSVNSLNIGVVIVVEYKRNKTIMQAIPHPTGMRLILTSTLCER